MAALTVHSAEHEPVDTVNLGAATDFAVLAGSEITNVPLSAIIGDVGLSPAAATEIKGLTCAEVIGTIYAVDTTGPECFDDRPGLLTTAKDDLTTAYNDAAGRPGADVISTELGGATLTGGVYKSAAGTFGITTGAGALTLDGQGHSDSVWIFQMASTLITAANSSVNLINGADACNVFWQVGSSATLGTDSDLVGTVMADQSIAVQSGARVDGRVLARIAAVTLDQAIINVSICPTVEPTAAPTDEQPTAAPTDEPTAAPTDEQPTAAPTDEPTAAPTDEQPTAAPTDEQPTAAPTDEPTAAPNEQPTAAPTDEPTAAPTDEQPTAAPNEQPTAAPTDEQPTAAPTDEPTAAPTDEQPTAAPHEQPTQQPTDEVGAVPAVVPEATSSHGPLPDTGSLPPTSGSEIPGVLLLVLLAGAAAATWIFLRSVTRVSVREKHR